MDKIQREGKTVRAAINNAIRTAQIRMRELGREMEEKREQLQNEINQTQALEKLECQSRDETLEELNAKENAAEILKGEELNLVWRKQRELVK